VSKDHAAGVKAYVERQKEHHEKDQLWPDWEKTFIDEE
jgi:hypothetical protein